MGGGGGGGMQGAVLRPCRGQTGAPLRILQEDFEREIWRPVGALEGAEECLMEVLPGRPLVLVSLIV